MSIVELVVTGTKVWARGTSTHWDGPPSILLGSSGPDFVVGEPLTPAASVVSAIQYLESDRIALPPRMPTAVQALSAVMAVIMDRLGVALPCDRIVVVHPTAWGPRNLDTFATATRQFTREVVFETCAVRASDIGESTRRSRRTAVLEFGMLSTTATTIVYDPTGTRIEAVEAEPELAAAELDSKSGVRQLESLLSRLLADRPADVLQVFGATDLSTLRVVEVAAEEVCGTSIVVSPLSGTDLSRPASRQTPVYTPTIPPATPEWMQPLRERAAGMHPVDHRPLYLGAGALAVVIAAAAVCGFFLFAGSGDSQTSIASTTSSAAPGPTLPPTVPSSATMPRPTTETVGSVVVQIPAGWRRSPTAAPATRAVLVPEDGTPRRITITQQSVSAGAGYDEVAADLDAQIKKKPAGTVTGVRRDVIFAGRSGLSYEERPADRSAVRWQVLVEHGVQVSIGCQYAEGGWDDVRLTCEQVVGAVHIGPTS